MKCFTRPLCADDRKRFDPIAPHVRNLEATDWITYRTPLGALIDSPREWLSRGDGRPFLPNLKSLRWSYHCLCGAADVGVLAMFFSPSIVSLDLDLRSIWSSFHDAALSLLSDAIRHASFHIVELTIRGVSLSLPPAVETSHHKLLRAIMAALPKLKRLHVDHRLFVAIRRYYHTFMQLESLALSSWPSSEGRFESLQFEAIIPRWESMRALSGRCGMDEIVYVWTHLISCVGQSVCTIVLHGVKSSATNFAFLRDYQQLLSVIGTSCPALESLSVSGIDFIDFYKTSFDAGVLRPLYKCSRLSELTIQTFNTMQNVSVSLANSDIAELARAFQNLRILHFGNDPPYIAYPVRSPRLTLSAIRTLVTSCLKLESLTLTIDAREIG
jgi:hypothetical protein